MRIKLFEEYSYDRHDEAYHVRESLLEAVDVFHGSGDRFDRFDISRVGSAQGGEVGGWGIYFSTDRRVANRYTTRKGFVGEYGLRGDSVWFDLDEPDTETYRVVLGGLEGKVSDRDLEEFRSDFDPEQYGTTNMQVYDWLSVVLGGSKQASLFLRGLGFDGNRFRDRVDTDATNYVVFDTSSIIYK